MSHESLRLSLFGLLAGAAWGIVAWLLGARAYGPSIWAGVLASPFIGLLVARLTHPPFARSSGFRRWLWALASLYLGALLFALPIAFYEVAIRGAGRNPLETVLEQFVAVLWGITLTGFVIALWPMAWLTHLFMEDRRF